MNPRKLSKICFIVLATALLFTGRVCSAGPGSPWALLDVPKVLEAAAEVTQERFPNCDEVTVDEKIMEIYQADGRTESQDEFFTKVLTEKGRRNNSVVTTGFLLPYFTVRVPRLDVIKPDGRVVAVDVAANSKESIDNSQMAENIYDPNSRILQVNVPGLEIGDLVHVVVRRSVRRPIIPNQFSDEFVFEGHGYIRHVSCEIRGPAASPLRHIELRDRVGHTVAASRMQGPNQTVIYHWEVNRVPRMYDEPAMPPLDNVVQRLLVSTLPDWAAVSRWYWNLSRSHLGATSPGIKRTVASLTAGAGTELDKIKKIFYYVAANIRYMGVTPEKNRPGFEPHDVSLTFAKRYGVCRDKAALLVAMLRLAGLKAYPVLINLGRRLDATVPSPGFNHAIAAVESAPGRYRLMDPTDEHTRALLPAYDDHQSYLVCRPEGAELSLSPVTPADRNMMRIRTSGELKADGTLTASSVLSFGGINGDAYRGALAARKPDERRRFLEKRLQRIMPGLRLTALLISPKNIMDKSIPLQVKLGFSAPGMAALGGKRAIVSTPWLGRAFGLLNYILRGTGRDSRKYPLKTQVTCGLDERLSLKTADNFLRPVSLPPDSSQNDQCLTYQRRYRLKAHRLEASKYFQLKVVEFSPKQYLSLKQVLKDLAGDERLAPVFATNGPGPSASLAPLSPHPKAGLASNAVIEADHQELTVKDAHTAVLRVHYVTKVLSYAGKIRESEVKIPYNPATETARIIHAAVISKSGKRQERSKSEVNVMDAAWNASAKRYTGGKVLVDSLPGVEIGSTIEVDYEITKRGRPYLSGFQPFQLPDGIKQKSFRITAPSGLELHTLQTGPGGLLSQTRQKLDSGQSLEWRARQVQPLAKESSLPPAWSYQAGVAYYVGNPADYFRELNRTMLGRAARSSRAAELARRITAQAATKPAAVQAVRDYVAKNVRLAGPKFSQLPLGELSAADTTLADGYGHAADRAILIQAMLAAVGLKADFVLAADLPAVKELSGLVQSFPFSGEFDTPLVRVSLDGRTYYLNDTDQYAHLGSTRHDHCLGIELSSGAGLTILAADGCHDGQTTSYSLVLDKQGRARIAVKHEYFGLAFAQVNRLISELRPEQRVHYFQEAVSDIAQGARPVGGLVTDFKVYPGVEQFEVEVDRYAGTGGGGLYFGLPFTPQLFPTGTNRRTQPLLLPDYFDHIIRTRIQLPPGHRRAAIAPRNARFAGPDGAGSAQVMANISDGEITYRLEHRPAIIRPSDYPAAFALESALENRAAGMFLFEPRVGVPASGKQGVNKALSPALANH